MIEKKEIIISNATLNDLDLVCDLFNQYRVFYGQISDVDAAKNFIHDRMVYNESAIFLAIAESEAGKIPLGFIQLYPSFSSVSMKKVWILNDLYVVEVARKQGIGELLMKKATEFASTTNAKGITLCTALNNYPAQKLYEKMDYCKNENFIYYYNYFE